MAEMRFRRRNCEIAFQANGQTSLRRRERAPGKGSALLWLSLSNRSRGARSASFTSKCLGGPNCQGYCHPSPSSAPPVDHQNPYQVHRHNLYRVGR